MDIAWQETCLYGNLYTLEYLSSSRPPVDSLILYFIDYLSKYKYPYRKYWEMSLIINYVWFINHTNGYILKLYSVIYEYLKKYSKGTHGLILTFSSYCNVLQSITASYLKCINIEIPYNVELLDIQFLNLFNREEINPYINQFFTIKNLILNIIPSRIALIYFDLDIITVLDYNDNINVTHILEKFLYLNKAKTYRSFLIKEYKKRLPYNLFFKTTKRLYNAQIKLFKDIMNFPLDLSLEELNSLNLSTYSLLRFPICKIAYLLGYPIHIGIPDTKTLKQSLLLLNRIGPHEYMIHMAKNHIVQYPITNFSVEIEDKAIIIDDIYNYNPLNYITILDNNHLYIFTRENWNDIKTNRINSFTRNPIDSFIINSIIHREILMQEHDLNGYGNIEDNLKTLY